ncbi:MAG: alpha amylase C-terminal domain-containing protein [Alkalispirochaetaceae bacterium]
MGGGVELGKSHTELNELWRSQAPVQEEPYRRGERSFCTNLTPSEAVALPLRRLLKLLRSRYGRALDLAVSAEQTDPERTALDQPEEIASPRRGEPTPDWARRTNMVGINIRTVGSFMEVAKYALTIPRSQDSIHLLPVWEPGVVGSLYGMSSWNINGEFLSRELLEEHPHLDTPARQLKALVNLLHLMGKSVGMDVIPHTDRFSQIVIANPSHFEWLRREDTRIIDHREDLHEEVAERIFQFLRRYGSAVAGVGVPGTKEELFGAGMREQERLELLFGRVDDPEGRRERRGALAREIYTLGYEPVPATMAPPYRGLEVDLESEHIDGDGHLWRDYRICRPEPMSRVFGPLTRYKLYGRLEENRNWEIDFSRPREEVWAYVARHYGEIQDRYGFDFMRGDMSHVQMRPSGVPREGGEYYDLLATVKERIRRSNQAPYFAYFAESFLSPPNVIAYGNEVDHLELARAEATLGDLQSKPFGSDEFLKRLRRYRDIHETRTVSPAVTMMTADKDDPRFDEFYLAGNEARYFLSIFLTDMPSYMGANFECRNIHYNRGENEEYTKLYVFQERSGPKATSGPFRFGRNGYLFYRISRIRLFLDSLEDEIVDYKVTWLLPPDATGGERTIAWSLGSRKRSLLCLVNCDTTSPVRHLKVPLSEGRRWRLLFSTEEGRPAQDTFEEGGWMEQVDPGEALLYELE